MIDAMGIGIIVPVMPDLLSEVSKSDLASAAVWGGILSTVFAIMQFVCGPLLGNLSDRYGRRPILLLSLAVMAVDYLVMAIAGSIWLLLIARIVGGITAATSSTANAFIADISKPEEKSANFGLVGAAFGIGFVIGPIIGGLLGNEFGPRAPFYAAAGVAFLNLVLGFFVLPETVTDKIRRPFKWAKADPFAAFRDISSFPGLSKLLVFSFLLEFAFIVYPAIWPYFTKVRFDWSPGMVGLSLGAYGISMALVQAGLIRVVIPKFGEARCILFGLIIEIFGFLFLAFVTNGVVALIIIPITALGAVVTPSLQGIMSRSTSDDRQGELQGVITSVRSVAMILAPLVMTQIFKRFASEDAEPFLPGAPFLLSMVLIIACFFVFQSYKRTTTTIPDSTIQ
ncbi:UNVERIFIED_CONTAM: hypothetical protein GTU68_001188 [Idotea baltica]|nr:hypothetical protein [Idotea baltica]